MKERWYNTINPYPIIAIIFGIFSTITKYRGFGLEDHIEQLPLILRAMDPAFLKNDFFLNASSASIARDVYSGLMAVLAVKPVNLPILFLFLTMMANIAIALVTYSLAKTIFNRSDRAGILAAALAMSVPTFDFGWSTIIYRTILVPTTLVIPFLLGAIYALVNNDLFLSIMLCTISAGLHPLLGLEMGAIMLATYFLTRFRKPQKIFDWIWHQWLPAFVLFIPFVLLIMLPQLSQSSLDSARFVEILAHFRHPHHYILSRFNTIDFFEAAFFLIALFFLIGDLHKTGSTSTRLTFSVLSGLILLICLAGAFFTEVIASRLWATAQVYRLLYFLKWLGLVLVAGWISFAPWKDSEKNLLLISVLSPISLGITVGSQKLSEKWGGKVQGLENFLSLTTLGVPVLFFALTKMDIVSTVLLLGGYLLFIQGIQHLPRKVVFPAIAVLSTLAVIAIGLHNYIPFMNQLSQIQTIGMAVNSKIHYELEPDGIAIAQFARENTPADSIFLTPPNWGQFRILAFRAIVVDFKAFPFTDEGMVAWYQRILTCYGRPNQRGFNMLSELISFYFWMTDEKLQSLHEKYGFSFAVLYQETPTAFPVIYQNDSYKLVTVNDGRIDLEIRGNDLQENKTPKDTEK